MLYGFFVSQGMIPVQAAIGYGREKGDVRQGVGGGLDLSALEEARAVGLEVVQMLRKLPTTGAEMTTHPVGQKRRDDSDDYGFCYLYAVF